MIKPSNTLFALYQFDCARNIGKYSWKDDNPDKVERLNEWGIMANNKDNDEQRALFFFKQAVDDGNINAMINGFSVLWNAECYRWAYDWLKSMNDKPIKNVKCLWSCFTMEQR